MQRFHQLLFAVSFLALNWFAMMAVHELGHVVGAIVTGGSIERVVLYPLTISRTDVSPNPHPAIVVWLGPVLGGVYPLVVCAFVSHCRTVLRNMARFFAGFCLIANGAYIFIGSFERIGDCGEMLRTGTPLGAMLAFGAVTISAGLYLWHQLGSIKHFINNPGVVTPRMAYVASSALIILVAVGFVVSPQ